MAFEEFSAKGGKFLPQVTLNRSGGFGMSSGMHHKYALDGYSSVKLYYDKGEKKIGIRLIPSQENGAFKLKKRPDQKGAFFGAKSFLRAYDIDPKKFYGRYEPEE